MADPDLIVDCLLCRVRSSLCALPLRQRRAVLYHHVAGLPYAEVATLLGGSVVAARRAAADGMARLRRTYLGAPEREGAKT